MMTRFRPWFWPGVLLLFSLCVLLKLSGSSIGVWKDILYEPGQTRGLLFSTPKYIRADEWHGWTPAALSQSRQRPAFPVQNLSLGGERAPLLMSVPVAHYTMLFRPQFWGFFLLDFERGFSFFWCAKIFALVFATAWFFRELGVRNSALIGFGTIWIFFSGYVQWWFSSPAMLPEMLATWMICVGCVLRLFKETNRVRIGAALAGLVFCGVNFALCVYPPYQIPLLWVGLAIVIGVCLENRNAESSFQLRRGTLLVIGGVALILLALIPFWIDARSTLELVRHTSYPGARRSSGGDLSIFQLFSGVAGFFQTEKIFPKIYDNACEASNFYPLWPAALAAIAISWKRRSIPVPPLLAALGIIILALSTYCVCPLPKWLLNGTLLGLTTERRTLLPIGIAGILLCTIFLDRYRDRIASIRWSTAIGGAFWCAIAVLFWSASRNQPDFFPARWQLALALLGNAVVVLFFVNWRSFALTFSCLLVLSNGAVNPIMRGLSPLIDSQAFRDIDKLRASDPTAKWLVYHDFVLGQLVIATGAPILNGNKIVPDFTFLHRIDPEGNGDWIYNRYAYIGCDVPTPTEHAGAHLLQHDLYVLYLPPQAPPLRELNCRYFLFPMPWPEAGSVGFSLVSETQPSKIYIYHPIGDGGH